MIGSLALVLLAVQESHTAGRAAFAARYDLAGLEFEAAPDATLRFGAVEMRRGDVRIALGAAAPRTEGAFTLFERAPGVLERFERSEAGIEHSLVIDGPLGGDGDLVVRVELGGTSAELGERLADGSHAFGSISYGRLFGIDADGERTDGDVRLVPGGLELVIDDAWLDAAAWPITLDPLISNGVAITLPSGVGTNGLGESDHENDCVYDATTGWYLHVWRRQTVAEIPGPFGTTQTVTRNRVMYRRLNSSGSPVGTELQLSTNESYEPRVASVNRHDTFAVTWLEDVGDETRLMFRVYSASTGVATGAAIVIATDVEGEIQHHDLAGESSVNSSVPGRAYVVWVDGAGALKLTRVNALPTSAPTIVDTTTLAADPGLFDAWQQVSVARCTNSDGDLVVAVVRFSALTGLRRVMAMAINRYAMVLTTPSTVSGSDGAVANPSIDGGRAAPSRWVVAWDNGIESTPGATIDLRATALQVTTVSTTTIAASPVVTLRSSNQQLQPSVGWRPGMAIIASRVGLDVEVLMACDTTATIGELPSVVFDGTSGLLGSDTGALPCVVLRTSGGNMNEEEGLVLWQRRDMVLGAHETAIWMRRYDAFDPLANTTTVASGCGSVGTISVPTPPAIGNPDFRVELSGARPGAVLAILAISPLQQLAMCGTCTFAPISTLYMLPIVGGGAVKALPIPCNPALSAVYADVQWFVYEPGIAPCAALPDLGATNLLRLAVD